MTFFSGIAGPLGHQKIQERLRSLFSQGNASGSYLFSGMDSIGKKMTALWFAQMINCSESLSPCGRCNSCRKIISGNHPDVTVVEKKSDKTYITIDQVREEIIGKVNYRPYEGNFRVFVVDDAHLLNEQSQNALLKVLEEPGPGIVIILVTGRPGDLLPTVVSRCKSIKFSPLPSEQIKLILEDRPGVSGSQAALIGAISSGSPGRALRLVSDDSYWKMRKEILSALQKMPDGRLEDLLGFTENFRVSRSDVEKLEILFEIILLWFRDISFIQRGMRPELIVNSDYLGVLGESAYCYGPEDIVAIQDLTLEVRKLVFENNLNIGYALKRILIKVLQAGSVRI